jgi:Zn-dependent membrane protease YugP
MGKFRRTLNLVSNIAFVICLLGYLLNANQIKGFGIVLLVGWLSFAKGETNSSI